MKTGPESRDEQTTKLLIPMEVAAAQLQTQILAGEALCETVAVYNDAGLEQFRIDVRMWSSYTADLLSSIFTDSRFSNEFADRSSVIRHGTLTLYEVWEADRSKLRQKVARLKSIKQRLIFVPFVPMEFPLTAESKMELPVTTESQIANRSATAESRTVFVVHGHHEESKQAVARLLEKLGFSAVILHEQSNLGQTVMEKFERHSSVAFAVVLLTDDDVGAAKADSGNLKPRARQNVILELGYFIGTLRRENVAMLYLPGGDGVDIGSTCAAIAS